MVMMMTKALVGWQLAIHVYIVGSCSPVFANALGAIKAYKRSRLAMVRKDTQVEWKHACVAKDGDE